MSTLAIEGARQTVAAPERKPRRFGLFSVADIVDGGDTHWVYGGLTADGEECSAPEAGEIHCGPSPNKLARSWYSDIEGDPWLTYMYETCKTVGRYSEAAGKLRTRFLAAEQSAVEMGFYASVLGGAFDMGSAATVTQGIGLLEAGAAAQYGGQIILHLPPVAASEAASRGLLVRIGDHLETVTGSLVSVANQSTSTDFPALFATGGVTLYRGPLTEAGPVVNTSTNDYYALIERPYAALVDCLNLMISAHVCGCAGDAGGAPQ